VKSCLSAVVIGLCDIGFWVVLPYNRYFELGRLVGDRVRHNCKELRHRRLCFARGLCFALFAVLSTVANVHVTANCQTVTRLCYATALREKYESSLSLSLAKEALRKVCSGNATPMSKT